MPRAKRYPIPGIAIANWRHLNGENQNEVDKILVTCLSELKCETKDLIGNHLLL